MSELIEIDDTEEQNSTEYMSEISVIEDVEMKDTLKLIFSPKKSVRWNAVDRLESLMLRYSRACGELTEVGTPGLYSRTLFMPKGMICTSRVHATCHQFIISKGAVTVYNTLNDETVLFIAGDHGVTYPGTRRVLVVHEDCVWTTFHPTDKIKQGFDLLPEDEKRCIFNEIFNDISISYHNPLIGFEEGEFF